MLQFCNIYFIFYIYIVLPLRQDVAYFGVDMTKDPPEPKLTYYHCVEGECIKVKTFQIRPYFQHHVSLSNILILERFRQKYQKISVGTKIIEISRCTNSNADGHATSKISTSRRKTSSSSGGFFLAQYTIQPVFSFAICGIRLCFSFTFYPIVRYPQSQLLIITISVVNESSLVIAERLTSMTGGQKNPPKMIFPSKVI